MQNWGGKTLHQPMYLEQIFAIAPERCCGEILKYRLHVLRYWEGNCRGGEGEESLEERTAETVCFFFEIARVFRKKKVYEKKVKLHVTYRIERVSIVQNERASFFLLNLRFESGEFLFSWSQKKKISKVWNLWCDSTFSNVYYPHSSWVEGGYTFVHMLVWYWYV